MLITIVKKQTQRVLHQEFWELRGRRTLWVVGLGGVPWVSNGQPVLHLDEIVRSDGGPVPTEIIYFLCEKVLEPRNERIPRVVYIRLPILDTPKL